MMDLKDSTFDLKDFIFIGILISNILTFSLTAWWIRRQVHVIDVKVYLQITQRITDVWEQYKDAKNKNRNFKLVEVFNLLESLARLHYKRRIYGVTRNMVKEHLLEILTEIGKTGRAEDIFTQYRSGPDTYGYIQRFAKSNGIKGIPHS